MTPQEYKDYLEAMRAYAANDIDSLQDEILILAIKNIKIKSATAVEQIILKSQQLLAKQNEFVAYNNAIELLPKIITP